MTDNKSPINNSSSGETEQPQSQTSEAVVPATAPAVAEQQPKGDALPVQTPPKKGRQPKNPDAPKKERTAAQKAATERMVAARAAKRDAQNSPTPKAVHKVAELSQSDDEDESDQEESENEIKAQPKPKKSKTTRSAKPPKDEFDYMRQIQLKERAEKMMRKIKSKSKSGGKSKKAVLESSSDDDSTSDDDSETESDGAASSRDETPASRNGRDKDNVARSTDQSRDTAPVQSAIRRVAPTQSSDSGHRIQSQQGAPSEEQLRVNKFANAITGGR